MVSLNSALRSGSENACQISASGASSREVNSIVMVSARLSSRLTQDFGNRPLPLQRRSPHPLEREAGPDTEAKQHEHADGKAQSSALLMRYSSGRISRLAGAVPR